MKKTASLLLILIFINISSYATYPVDNFEDGNNINLGGGSWIPYTDGFSLLTINAMASPGVNGSSHCIKMNIVGKAGAQFQYGGIVSSLNSQGNKVDLSSYEGIRFWAKGDGNLQVQLPISATSTTYNHYQSVIRTTSEWKLFEISFKSFSQIWGTPQNFDLTTILGVQLNLNTLTGDSLTCLVDNIEFFKFSEYVHPPNEILPCPKINQVGYLPSSPKIFSISLPIAKAGASFKIIEETANTIAYSGTLNSTIINDSLSSGEKIITGDFSNLTQDGTYHILVDTFRSESFTIKSDVYHSIFQESLRTFYINRCGIALNDPHTGINHPECHKNDTLIRASTEVRDFTGAWHNAGDFGKWTHMFAIDISYMLWTYSLNRSSFENLQINIPESSNGISDILDEARWGLDWLFKMQNNDGSVFHKVDTEPNFAPGKRPDQDTLQRFASFQKASNQTPSTIDASDFVAIMLQAYRTFLSIDSTYAVKCKDAALKTWTWLQSAPLSGQDDPYYTDPDYFQEMLWAKCEMYRFTKDANLLNELTQDITSRSLESMNTNAPQVLGYLSIFLDDLADQGLKNEVLQQVKGFADNEIPKSDRSGYGVAIDPSGFSWESNEIVLHKGNMFIFSYIMTKDKKYLDYALRQMNYILGRNALNISFVSGFGGKKVLHPYHWAYLSENIALPGWIAGGPNQYTTNADPLLLARLSLNLSPAKCFIDDISYACNEGETTEAAALMFLSGFFFDENLTITSLFMPSKSVDEKKLRLISTYFSKDQLEISFNLKNQAEVDVVMYQLDGKIIFNKKINGNIGINNLEQQTHNIVPGLYLIQITANNESWMESLTCKRIKGLE